MRGAALHDEVDLVVGRGARHERADRWPGIEHVPEVEVQRLDIESGGPLQADLLGHREQEDHVAVRFAGLDQRADGLDGGRHPRLVVGTENRVGGAIEDAVALLDDEPSGRFYGVEVCGKVNPRRSLLVALESGDEVVRVPSDLRARVVLVDLEAQPLQVFAGKAHRLLFGQCGSVDQTKVTEERDQPFLIDHARIMEEQSRLVELARRPRSSGYVHFCPSKEDQPAVAMDGV